MAMLEGVADLTLALLNEATQAWVEMEYHRTPHSETGQRPIERFVAGPSVGRPAPRPRSCAAPSAPSAARTQRRSDGTLSLQSVRFEIPSRYPPSAHAAPYAPPSWDLSRRRSGRCAHRHRALPPLPGRQGGATPTASVAASSRSTVPSRGPASRGDGTMAPLLAAARWQTTPPPGCPQPTCPPRRDEPKEEERYEQATASALWPEVEPLHRRRSRSRRLVAGRHRPLRLAHRAAGQRGRLRADHRRAGRRQDRCLALCRRATVARSAICTWACSAARRVTWPTSTASSAISSASRSPRTTAGPAPKCCASAGGSTSRARWCAPCCSSTRRRRCTRRRSTSCGSWPAPSSTPACCSPWCSPATAGSATSFRAPELLPLGSRIRVRLPLEAASRGTSSPSACGTPSTPPAIRPADDPGADRDALRARRRQPPRAHEPRRRAARRRRARATPQLDEKLFFQALRRAGRRARDPRETPMTPAASSPAGNSPTRSPEQRWLVEQALECRGRRHHRRRAQVRQVAARPRPRRLGGLRHSRACAASPSTGPGACCSLPPRTRCRSCATASTALTAARGLDLPDLRSTSSPPPACASISRPTAIAWRRPSPARPRLLVLDPFVRLHAIDENAAGEVAAAARLPAPPASAPTTLPCPRPPRPQGRRPLYAPAKRCAAAPNSTPGATPISTCAAAIHACA